ncbi:hypothetical protein H312_03422, partial [Anncaliia algerae PRA339]
VSEKINHNIKNLNNRIINIEKLLENLIVSNNNKNINNAILNNSEDIINDNNIKNINNRNVRNKNNIIKNINNKKNIIKNNNMKNINNRNVINKKSIIKRNNIQNNIIHRDNIIEQDIIRNNNINYLNNRNIMENNNIINNNNNIGNSTNINNNNNNNSNTVKSVTNTSNTVNNSEKTIIKGKNTRSLSQVAKSLTSEQLERIKKGGSIRTPLRGRLLYLTGIQRNKISNVRLLLVHAGVSPKDVLNIAFAGNSVVELLVREEKAELIVQSLASENVRHLKNFNPCLPNRWDDKEVYRLDTMWLEEIETTTQLFQSRIAEAAKACTELKLLSTAKLLRIISKSDVVSVQRFTKPEIEILLDLRKEEVAQKATEQVIESTDDGRVSTSGYVEPDELPSSSEFELRTTFERTDSHQEAQSYIRVGFLNITGLKGKASIPKTLIAKER